MLCGTSRPSRLLFRAFAAFSAIFVCYQLRTWASSKTINIVKNAQTTQHGSIKKEGFIMERDMLITQPPPKPEKCATETEADINMFDLWNPPKRSKIDRFADFTDEADDNELFVVVAPFSHVDPGWLETFDEYSVSTGKILDNAVKFISENPRMTFQWTEMNFLKAWWSKADTDQRSKLQKLISDGNIELTSGSLVMTDEASAHYWASIDNIVEGHRFLVDEMGLKDLPKVAFSNDPFGYSPTVPYLFSKAGISDLVIHRISDDWKRKFGDEKRLEFNWRQLWDTTHENDVLTHAMAYAHYDIVNSCGPETHVCCQFDFRRVRQYQCPGPRPQPVANYNLKELAEMLVHALRDHALNYPLNMVLFMFGDDFRFDVFWEWDMQYGNLVKIFDYINNNYATYKMKIDFGTLSTYFTELKRRQANAKPLPSLVGDFFPYSDNSYDYWTGYYTTRPVNKRLERILLGNLRAADILLAMTEHVNSYTSLKPLIRKMNSAHSDLALFQHHDAITGTSRPHVAADYAKRLVDAIRLAQNMSALSVRILHHLKENPVPLVVVDTTVNALKPVAIELTDQSTPAKLLLVNSLAHARRFTVRVRVRNSLAGLAVFDSAGTEVPSQVNPAVDISTAVFRVVDGEVELAMNVQLPALSMTVYSIQQRDSLHNFAKILMPSHGSSDVFTDTRFPYTAAHDVEKEFMVTVANRVAYYDSDSGILKGIQEKNQYHQARVDFRAYYSTMSGAYVFKPNPDGSSQMMSRHMEWISVAGHLVADTYSVYENLIHFSSLVSEEDSVVHFGNVLDVRKENSAEIVMRLNVNVKNEEHVFFTDSNGFQMMKRQYRSTRAEQANYYPIATTAFLEDAEFRCTVNTAHPVGVTGQRGMLQFMLDRKLMADDNKGIGNEYVPNDNLPTRSDFVVRFEKRTEKISRYVSLSYSAQHDSNALLSPPMAFTVPSSVESDLLPIPRVEPQSLPCSLDIVSLRHLSTSTSQILLTLRRYRHDCGIERTAMVECEAADHKSLGYIIRFLGRKVVQPALLSSLQTGNQDRKNFGSWELDRRIKPMEVESVLLS